MKDGPEERMCILNELSTGFGIAKKNGKIKVEGVYVLKT